MEASSSCRKEVLVVLGDLLKVGQVQDSWSACHHEPEEHKQCLPGLPARALGHARAARGRLLALCPSGTCCPFPSECPVPSPASLLPKALQAVAEVLHRQHPGLLPTACHTEELFLDLL